MERSAPTLTIQQLAAHRGDYGVDAPLTPFVLGLMGLLLLGSGLFLIWLSGDWRAGAIFLLYGLVLLLSTASYLYTTRRGKFLLWARILVELQLDGDEQVLDLGCGRGAILLMVARLLPQGRAVGVDIWKSGDQSGNTREATERNARLEGVAGRIALYTADMRNLPFADNTFDLVVSNAAIHNIPHAAGREAALKEAVRVLKPGGRLVVADINKTRQYARTLERLGMVDIVRRGLGWRGWYGGPWVALRLVSARKPILPR
jgi:arsenite methyltransferase